MSRPTEPRFDTLLASAGELGRARRTGQAGEIQVEPGAVHSRPAVSAALRAAGCRHACVFAEDRTREESLYYVYDVFEHPQDPRHLLVRFPVAPGEESFPSISAGVPALNWMEREIQDWFGIEAAGHPNPRRVALHDHWPEVHPLRKDFPAGTVLPPFEGEQHTFRPTLGEGVFYIPVGPVHAGIIEPGHFNFAVAGEPVIYLQLRMFYTHKGTEKKFEQLPARQAVYLAESVSGDSSFAHGLAFCLALEKIAGIEVPAYAQYGRVIFLELERLYNHVADIGAIAADVGFMIASAHAARLREMLLRVNEETGGSRLLRGVVCPGGLRRKIGPAALGAALDRLRVFEREFDELAELIERSDSTIDRLEHTGVLTPAKAHDLGVIGLAGRASGQDLDVRRDHSFAAYADLPFEVPVFQEGDVLSRMRVRIEEVRQSARLIRAAAARLPGGPAGAPLPPLPEGRSAFSAVEGWRGEIFYWLRSGPDGMLARCKVKDPSLNNWPALVEALQGNIIPDFPVINKSFNLSYSGTDR